MGIFTRNKPEPEVETRAIDGTPWGTNSVVGGPVSDVRALQLVPIFASVRVLADSISTLPLQTYRKSGDSRVRITDSSLIRKPSPRGTLGDWLRKAVISLALHGNAYGLITGRDGLGFVTGIEWLDPNTVSVDESNPLRPIFYYAGRPLSDDELVHLTWLALPGKVVGISPLEAARQTVSTGLGATAYGSDWFSNGGVPPGTFKNSGRTLTDEESNTVKVRLNAAIKTHQPLVYGKDWDYAAIGISPDQAQFIETHRLTATQIATIYGIPPERIGGDSAGSLTYTTTESNEKAFVTHALLPWLVRIEDALSALLPAQTFVKFNFDALIRPDTKTRFEVYALMRANGLASINEIRALEDWPGIGPEGDTYLPQKPEPIAVKVEPNDPPEPVAEENTDE